LDGVVRGERMILNMSDPSWIDRYTPGSCEHLLQMAANAYAKNQWPEVSALAFAALQANPPIFWNTIIREFSGPFHRSIFLGGGEKKFARELARVYGDHPSMNVISIHDDYDNSDAIELRRKKIEQGLPSVALVCMGKSGSVAVGSIFNRGFALPTVTYSLVSLRVIPAWAADYARGGACYIMHLLPREENARALLDAGFEKIIVHVRDPRQAFLSWLYYGASGGAHRPDMTGRQISSLLADHFQDYESLVTWLKAWVDLQEKGLPVVFTTFEKFITDRDGFVEELLGYYSGDRRYFDREAALGKSDDVDYHFRKGRIDEWREVFSRDECNNLNKLLPDYIVNQFGWER
jgi:hypothetical protein